MPGDNQPPSSNQNTARPLPILAVSLALGLLFDYLLYGKLPGAGFLLYVVAIVVGALMVARSSQQPVPRAAYWFLALAVGFAAMVAVRASFELTFMNVALALFLLLLAVKELQGEDVRRFIMERYLSLSWLPMYFLGNIGLFFSEWYRRRSGTTPAGMGSKVVRGTLMALPVLAVFVLLFSSADLVFRKYVTELININISPETLVRSFLVVFVTLGFGGAGWYMFTKARKAEQQSDDAKRTNLGSTEVRILLGSVNVLFLLFIIVQLVYLFGGQQNITSQDFTFAEYARRGFFELIVVAVISWLVVWMLDRTLTSSDATVQRTAKFLSLALIVQVFLIMTSAFMRLVLYEQAYGFTTLRFYSHVFTVWLAVVFVLLLYKLFISRREDRLAFSILVSALMFAGAVNVFNPDAFIAKQNIDRYATTGKVDAFYLDQLSADAVPGMLPLLETKDVEVAKIAANRFFWKLDRFERTSATWQSFNIGRRSALKLLRPIREELEKSKDFIPSLNFLESQSTVSD